MSGTAWESFSNGVADYVEMEGDKFGQPCRIRHYNLLSAVD